MNINEQTIFDFTFFPEKLTPNIIRTIENNEVLFPFISFNTKLKDSLISDISLSTKMKLEKTILDYNKNNITIKFPQKTSL